MRNDRWLPGRIEKSKPSWQTWGRTAAVPLHVNLGVDFGTCFTKICFRDVATGDSGVLSVDGECFVPSVVGIGEWGELSAGERAVGAPERYLKMRLADETWPHSGGSECRSRDTDEVRALAAYFLADVMERGKNTFVKQQSALAEGREITYSANVGVPVEQYDSPTVEVFREVFQVAWEWCGAGQLPLYGGMLSRRMPQTVDEAVREYAASRKLSNASNASQADCHAVPEIVAGITSFLGSRDARPGRYGYFDIGGGTVDGVLLGYNRYDGSPRTHCYAGKVESLGVASLAYRAYGEAGHRMERAIAGGAPRSEVDSRLRPFENDLHTLVAKVIVDGWSKDAGALSGLADQELPVFVGGGGAQSAWYRRNIRGAYDSRQHRNVGIPPYRITEVPRPTDLNYQFSGDVQFSRFAVAYGLSVPYEEISGFDLPRRTRRRSRDNMERRRRSDVIPFERYGAVYG